MKIPFQDKTFCFTGKFLTLDPETEKPFTRTALETIVLTRGGQIKKGIVRSLDYLVVGGAGSSRYAHGTKGKKLLQAEQQANTQILSETQFLETISSTD